MTVAKLVKNPYVVYYCDQTFQTINLTKADYEAIVEAMVAGKPVAALSIGVMRLADIRSLFERIEPPKADEKTEAPDYEGMTMEEAAYLWEETAKIEALKQKQRSVEN